MIASLNNNSSLADRLARTRALAAWESRVREKWSQVHIEAVDARKITALKVGDEIRVWAKVHLGDLSPEDVNADLYLGRVNAAGEIMDGDAIHMEPVRSYSQGRHLFEASAVTCEKSGLHGYTVRVYASHPDLAKPFLPGLIAWANRDKRERVVKGSLRIL